MRRRLVPAAAAAALLALLLAGCTAGAGQSDAPVMEPGEMAPQQQVEGEDAAGGTADGEQFADRSMITVGWVSITVEDPVDAAQQAVDLAEARGGRVDSRTETPGTDAEPPSASLTLRIPSDDLDPFLAELRELGTVSSVSMNASDVTQQRKDLDGRIDALTASVDRLQQLLSEATTIADLIAIESELTTRQAELDSLTQQRDALVDQVDYSTITVDLVTEGVAPDPQPDDFWSGLAAGWNALIGFATWLGIAVGVLLPWALAALVIGAIVLVIVLVATRSRRSKPAAPDTTPGASDPSPPAAPPASDAAPQPPRERTPQA
ncbi:DUF4349 domain-containing protein [Agromyces mariniharenae]|uniref:DUF4349 domain-containing protein n=1 Tax=Agromyces mariniharenae TaxID=2604423 RepID=A0A5S4VAX7_9MICO|nr:DUF4349 domain-containing protein [Agromyces mariniharenae]TYL54491.1 DUF4349 domain-containing protein [Agromyces mariniharenae]